MDNRSNNSDKARQTFLFQHLVVMFQALALQQMGKLTSPITVSYTHLTLPTKRIV